MNQNKIKEKIKGHMATFKNLLASLEENIENLKKANASADHDKYRALAETSKEIHDDLLLYRKELDSLFLKLKEGE